MSKIKFKSIAGKARLALSVATAALALAVSVAAIIPLVSCNRIEGESSAVQPLMDLAWDLNDEPEQEPETDPTYAALANGDSATVYFTKNITPAGIRAIYDAIGVKPATNDKVAVKVHTGESETGGKYQRLHILKPELIGDLVRHVDGTIVETNTAIEGIIATRRANKAAHLQLAADHGFTAIHPSRGVVIMDGDAIDSITVTGGSRLGGKNYVGKAFRDFDFHVVLSHFKGHAMGGFGGALKNASIGYASKTGKFWIHSAGSSRSSFSMNTQSSRFMESMAEAAKSVVDHANRNGEKKIVFITVMYKMSLDCDCILNPRAPSSDLPDEIGIFGSTDPVALDQACINRFNALPSSSGKTAFLNQINSLSGLRTIDRAAEMGLGTKTYKLIDLDEASSIKETERVAR